MFALLVPFVLGVPGFIAADRLEHLHVGDLQLITVFICLAVGFALMAPLLRRCGLGLGIGVGVVYFVVVLVFLFFVAFAVETSVVGNGF